MGFKVMIFLLASFLLVSTRVSSDEESSWETFYAKAPVKAPTLPVKPPAKAPVKAPSPAPVKAPAPSIKLLPPRVPHFVEEGANCIPGLGTAQEFVLHAVNDANVFHLVHLATRRCVGSAILK
ncbi:hypothetical protein IFM89_026276 [Coptis chinensis]|uniref:Uncharacterized protein n=1 Tax=Coptis chinensis TaxID=261450 RepID=A0A835IX49_9MAGN|nr:hypothetical protein IFM89_026276 [Coptis chinensis]